MVNFKLIKIFIDNEVVCKIDPEDYKKGVNVAILLGDLLYQEKINEQ